MYQEITLEGFINEVNDVTYGPHSRQFCFFLGSGASKTSGIPSGMELVDRWDAELKKRHLPKDYEQWKQEKQITDENKYSHYSDYYEKRFSSDRIDGFNFLESLMEKAVPSGGYACLAHLLTSTPHNVVVTTNFDRLTEDSITLYTHQISSVVGHEAMAHYITRNIHRPTVVKIHHDLLSDPRNQNTELQKLGDKWRESLAFIFSQYNPIFIGYAGNDQDVIDYLAENAENFKENGWKRPYWLLYGSQQPEQKVIEFLDHSNAFLIRHQGFDDVMAQLAVALEIKFPSEEEFIQNAKKQYKKLQTAIEQVQLSPKNDAPKASAEGENGDNKADDDSISPTPETFADTPAKAISSKLPPQNGNLSNTDILLRFVISHNSGHYSEALFYIEELLQREPDNARYHENCSATLHAMGRYDEALTEAKKAIELEPNNAIYHDSYSATLHAMGRYDEALSESRKAIELDPDNARYHNSCGVTLQAMGQYDEALIEKKKAIDLEPDNARYHDSYSTVLHKMSRYDEALIESQKAIGLDSNNAKYHDSCGITLHEMGRYKEAVDEKKKAIELEPDNARYHDSCGATLHEMGEYAEALVESQKSIELEPDNASYHDSCCATLYALGRYQEALTESQKAIHLEPDNPQYYTNLSAILTKLGNAEEAAAAKEKANQLRPKQSQA